MQPKIPGAHGNTKISRILSFLQGSYRHVVDGFRGLAGPAHRDDEEWTFSGIETEAQGRGGPIQPVDCVLEAGIVGANDRNVIDMSVVDE